jgi:hypothetical protein
MTVMTEPVHTGEFLVSEGNNSISREKVVLAPNQTLLPGTVVYMDAASDQYLALDAAAADAFATAGGVLLDRVDTGDEPGEGVLIARLAEVDGTLLLWQDLSEEQINAGIEQLKPLNIFVREGEPV